MAIPLVMTGPGGDFVTRYHAQGKMLVASVGSSLGQQPDTETAGSYAGFSRWSRQRRGTQPQGQAQQEASPSQECQAGSGSDGFEHVPARPQPGLYHPRPDAARSVLAKEQAMASILAALDAWLRGQQRSLEQLEGLTRFLQDHNGAGLPEAVEPLDGANDSQEMSYEHEPDPQAIAHPHPHPRPARGSWLLADHAGAGGRAGREQSHHLRTRRSAHQKAGALAAAQQGTLFGS